MEHFVRATACSTAALGCSVAAQARSRRHQLPHPFCLPAGALLCLPVSASPCLSLSLPASACLWPALPSRSGAPAPRRGPARGAPRQGRGRRFQLRPPDGSGGPLLRARRGRWRFLPQRRSQLLPGARVYINKYFRLISNHFHRSEGGREPRSCQRGALLPRRRVP